MESGNQTCNGNCADLPIATMNKQIHATVISIQSVPGNIKLSQLFFLSKHFGVIHRSCIGQQQANAKDKTKVLHG